MPISKQATKKMHHDRVVTKKNQEKKQTITRAIKTLRKKPSKKALDQVFSLLDKAAKANLFHKNKASRLKSRLAKLLVK